MQLWHWLLLLGLVFLVSYNPRTGNLGKFFGPEISVEDHDESSREAQSDSNPRKRSE